jgi:ADP-heptose:LPS heptosyltransferase
MNLSSLPDGCVIIAFEGKVERLRQCIISLEDSFSKRVVVSSDDQNVKKITTEMGVDHVVFDSQNPIALWQAGITLHYSPWNLLIRSNEVLTARVREGVLKKIRSNQTSLSLFPLKPIFVLLKKRLKYGLERELEMPSGLAYFPKDLIHSPLEKVSMLSPIEGEYMRYEADTMADLLKQCSHRIENLSDQMFLSSSELTPFFLFFKGIWHSLKTFLRCFFLKKAVKEGFEGFVFSFFEFLTIAGTYLRYYEKYRRSGRFLKKNLKILNKILVIKTRGIGDACIATPVLKAIKLGLPKIKLSVLTYNHCKDVYVNNPNVDTLYGVSPNPSKTEIKKLIKVLNHQKFDLILNLHSKNFSDKLARRINARWRISNSYFQRTKISDVHVGSPEKGLSVFERDLECVKAMGLPSNDKFPELFPTESELDWARQFLQSNGYDLNRKVIVIHPWSSQAIREWGVDRYGELCKKLHQEYDCQIVINCDESEFSKTQIFREYVPEIIIFKGSIRKLIALIHEADLMIGNDSGPTQFPPALNTPCLIFVGNEFKEMYRDLDIFKGKFTCLYKDVPCRDLLSTLCFAPCENRVCLDFSVTDVLNQALDLIEYK